VACASVDITELGTQQVTPEKWYGGLVKTLVSRLGVEERFSFPSWRNAHKDIPAVQFFREFIEEVLLAQIARPIIIFIDEIDSVLQLSFKDDFFALIRACFNKRAENEAYNRLSFVLLGVATPGDLIADKDRTPFNIGRAVELHGFQLDEVEPLVRGLEGRVSNPQAVIEEILAWTGGQPFLTQKLCQLVVSSAAVCDPPQPPLKRGENILKVPRDFKGAATSGSPHQIKSAATSGSPLTKGGEGGISNAIASNSGEKEWIEALVRRHVIENWEATDEPEHLKTIRDRILSNEQRAAYLLELYQQVWQQGEVVANNSFEEGKLQLSGVVVKRRGGNAPVLQVYNRIYYEVFNLDWIEQELAALRPYSEAFRAWVASGYEDESRLLRGKALQDAQAWGKERNLSYQDREFLSASGEKEREEQIREAELERERKDREAAEKRNRVLAEANRKARRRIQIGGAVLSVALLGAFISVGIASQKVDRANDKVAKAEEKTQQSERKEEAAIQRATAAEEEERLAKDNAKQEQQKTQQAKNDLIAVARQRDAVTGELENLGQESQRLEKEAERLAREGREKTKELNQTNKTLILLKEREEVTQQRYREAQSELQLKQGELQSIQRNYQQTQDSLARVNTEIETVSLLSKLAGELQNNGLSADAQEAWSQASQATNEILEKEENRELKQAMLQASISLASLQLSQKYQELEREEKAKGYWNKAEQAIQQSQELLPSNVAVDTPEQWSVRVHMQRVQGSWYRENEETQKAIDAYQQAFSRLEEAWEKLPNVDDINTEIPIPQYLPQEQPILSANAIENLHREFMALLAQTGQDNSHVKESLKRHLLAELNFFMESGNWKDADVNTFDLIIFAGSNEGDFDFKNLSCRDLDTIDRLWVERSGGKFGFSVQKSILDRFASQPGRYDGSVNWEGFYEKIGWYKEGNYIGYESGIYNPERAVVGHLPLRVKLWGGGVEFYGCEFVSQNPCCGSASPKNAPCD
jgi:hypothetical protein